MDSPFLGEEPNVKKPRSVLVKLRCMMGSTYRVRYLGGDFLEGGKGEGELDGAWGSEGS